MLRFHGLMVASCLIGASHLAQAQHTGQLTQNGWHSDDTRADGTGTNAAGVNLVSPILTSGPEAGSGNPAHDADIRRQIRFGAAAGTVPMGTHGGAVHLVIGPSGSGKSQISHRKNDLTGHCAGSDAFGPGMNLEYSWMGNGTVSVTTSVKFGVKTSEFGLAGTSPRTGENDWDKVLIYEPGNLNGGVANGNWFTETVDYTTGRWWFFDRVAGAGTIGTPLTLADMSVSGVTFSGAKTIGDVYALITAPGAIVTSVQFGVGSGNANASVYVNQFETNFYRSGSVTTFGNPELLCDQDVTNNIIFGAGNANGSFTVARTEGIELGLRTKLRFDENNLPQNTFNSNGDGTYTFNAGAPTGGASWAAATTPVWSVEWSVNTDYDGTTGLKLDDLTYAISMDFSEGPGNHALVFDPITPNSTLPYTTPFVVPNFDNSIGDNSTGSGGGTSTPNLVTYQGLIAANNLAQNSWNLEFFNEAQFAGFDPNLPGRYDFSLTAFAAGDEVARTAITVFVVATEEFDQNVTNAAIFGSGNINGSYTTVRGQGVELGIRGKLRFGPGNLPQNVFNSNGDGTYTFEAGSPTGGAGWVAATTPIWNFEWSINTDYDGSTLRKVGDYDYEMGIDFDASAATDYLVFDPVELNSVFPYTIPEVKPFWDHSMGDNTTAMGMGVEASDSATYAGYLTTYNLAQNSWNPEFNNEPPFDYFNPNEPGRYDIYLAAFDNGVEVARSAIAIIVRDGTSLSLEADACQKDADCSLPGVQIEVDVWMRNLASNATGYQAFLSFDPTKLTFEGAASSYSAAPFPLHIQSMASANVAPGQLRLDGSVNIGSPSSFGDDAKVATLVFTVDAECDPTSVEFDLTQAFDSELSFQGSSIATNLVNSSSIVADATPPIMDPVADIIVAADAGVSGGCDSAVVNFTAPFAFDTCGDVTVECFPPSGTAFPAGETTTVTCVATDDCGNQTFDTFDVTVTSTNLVYVQLQLVGVNTAVDRCIRFVADDCGTETEVELSFDATGFFSGSVEIPCGNWMSLCVKDAQHTLWGTTSLSLDMSGTAYVGDSVVQLHGGDTDDDGDIDINDVTWYLFQFGQLAADGDCGWDGTRDADFDNNGAVGSSDYAFLTANWLASTACGCLGMSPDEKEAPGNTRSRRRVTQTWEATVDFNNDGWIDHHDVRIHEQRRGLPNTLSQRMRP